MALGHATIAAPLLRQPLVFGEYLNIPVPGLVIEALACAGERWGRCNLFGLDAQRCVSRLSADMHRVLLLAGLGLVATAALAGPLEFLVRDNSTGYFVVASVKYARAEDGWSNPVPAYTDSSGWFRRTVPDGYYLAEVSASGYKKMRWAPLVRPGRAVGRHTMRLSRKEPPYEFSDERVDRLFQPGRCLLHGFVLDADTLKPLRGVVVEASPSGLEAVTNSRGFYETSIPVPIAEYPMIDEVFRLRGYGTVANRNMLVHEGANCGGGAEMIRGGPPVEKDLTHRHLRPAPSPPVQTREVRPNPSRFRRPQAIMDWLHGPRPD